MANLKYGLKRKVVATKITKMLIFLLTIYGKFEISQKGSP
jgi:hypothetical protein